MATGGVVFVSSFVVLARIVAMSAATALPLLAFPQTASAQGVKPGSSSGIKPESPGVTPTGLKEAEAQADNAIQRCDRNGFERARDEMTKVLAREIENVSQEIDAQRAQGQQNTEKYRSYVRYRETLRTYRNALRGWNPRFESCPKPESGGTVVAVPGGGGAPEPPRETPTERAQREVRRATDIAAIAKEEYEKSLCGGTQEQQDRAKANNDAAQRRLERAIENEAGLDPSVVQLQKQLSSAESAKANVKPGALNEEIRAEIQFQEALRRYNQALDEAKSRIKARIQAAETPPPPVGPISCGPGLVPSGVQVALGGRSTTMNVPTVNAGTRFTGGAEFPITPSARRLTGSGGFASVTLPGAGPISNFVIGTSFDQADASSSGVVPIGGGVGVAQTYIVPIPTSTGIGAGATGQSVSTSSEMRVFDAMFSARVVQPLNAFPSSTAAPMQVAALELGAGLRYRNTRRTDNIAQQSLTFTGLNSVIDLSTTSHFVAPQLSIGFVVGSAGPSGLFGGVRGSVSPGVQTTDGDASQFSRCVPCGAASPELNLLLQRDVSSSKFSVITGAMAYVGYRFTPNAQVLVEAAYEYQSAAPVFAVPTTPIQQPISLTTGSTNTFKFGGKLHVGFAPR